MEKKQSEREPPSSHATDIIRKGSVITIITLISRPLGYVREAIQAYLFGATLLVDAFIVAFNFPELIQTLFFSGATSAFLVPVCTKYLKDNDEYSAIYSTFINISLIITVLVSLVFFIFSGVIVDLIAPGFSPETKKITTNLFIIMIPVISLHTILSVMKAFLNAKEHFAAPEMSGILWNIAFIIAALALSKSMGIYGLAIGVSIGSLLQVVIQIPYLRKFNVTYRAAFTLHHPSIAEARQLFTGALIATSIVPINSFVGRIIGSYLPQGEVASLAYAFRIFVLPFSLFAVPVYTVMFSKVSKLHHENDSRGIFGHIDSSTILLCITLIPATIILCGMGDMLIRILYERGVFTQQATLITNRALFGYSIGLLFYALSLSFVRIFNALHDMKTPAIVGITSIALNVILAYMLMRPLHNLGISLATSIVSFYNFMVLYIIFKRKTHYRMTKNSIYEVIRSLFAGIIILLSIFIVRYVFPYRPYIMVSIGLVLTLIIYGLFFKNYYLSLIRKRL